MHDELIFCRNPSAGSRFECGQNSAYSIILNGTLQSIVRSQSKPVLQATTLKTQRPETLGSPLLYGAALFFLLVKIPKAGAIDSSFVLS